MKKLIVLLAALSLFGCGDDEPKKPEPPRDDQAAWVHYYKDKRTDLCFAGDGTINGNNHLGHDHSHLTNVPCTDAVERLVQEWPKYEN